MNELYVYPKMYKISQIIKNERIADLRLEVFKQLDLIGMKNIIKPSNQISITAGSRGIANIDKIIKYVCDYVKSLGGIPFIVPSMGSHGGATAEGQKQILKKLGITEEIMECEIRSSMEVVQLENASNGAPVYIDKHAFYSDGIIVVNRIKPHTDFLAENESGIVKMVAVGLGKEKGAIAMHGYDLASTIPLSFKVSSSHAPIIAGLGLVENSKDETYIIQGVKPENFLKEDARLLRVATEQVPHLPYDDIDVLVVKEMGKMYSGTGVDTKVIGRIRVQGVPEPRAPFVNKLVILRLSPDSYGNALGIGLADITTKELVDSIDYDSMYINLIATTYLERGKVPPHFKTEKSAIDTAFKTLGKIKSAEAKVMIIENTLHINELLVSESIYKEIKNKVNLIKEIPAWSFDLSEKILL
ncbi:MAG: lactate racemase domain-containing protein [Sedimentibacter sp.]